MSDPAALAEGVLRGERRAAARFITAIERQAEGLRPALARLEKAAGGKARVIGLTGPPGAGKSTLADAMIARWRECGLSVAVLAVDPSSPFGGGAILGDRIRMQRHSTDPDVFVRSMSARGASGGLARAAGDALTVLCALGADIVLVETVGVGQTEVEIASLCSCVLLLQTPAGGDIVQAIKAGIVEIGDIHVIGKPQAGDAKQMQRALREAVELASRDRGGWIAPVIVADAHTGAGMDEVASAIDSRFDWLAARPEASAEAERSRITRRAEAEALELFRNALSALDPRAPQIAGQMDAVLRREASTSDLADLLLERAAQAICRD